MSTFLQPFGKLSASCRPRVRLAFHHMTFFTVERLPFDKFGLSDLPKVHFRRKAKLSLNFPRVFGVKESETFDNNFLNADQLSKSNLSE